MITGTGGFVSRTMPPSHWDCGPVPQECYDKDLTKRQIAKMLAQVYLEPERVKKLADSEDPEEHTRARTALQTLAEIDADTIWTFNQIRTML